MRREIEAVHQDAAGEWVAELSCLHRQQVRQQPPRVGSPLDCSRCDRAELPDDLLVVRTTEVWDETTMPAALRRNHRVAKGAWGRLQVQAGKLRFRADTDPPLDVVVVPGAPQPIPPDVAHHVEPIGPVRFAVEFLRR